MRILYDDASIPSLIIVHVSGCFILFYFFVCFSYIFTFSYAPPMAIGTCLFISHSALHKFQVHLKFISRFDVCFIAFRSSPFPFSSGWLWKLQIYMYIYIYKTKVLSINVALALPTTSPWRGARAAAGLCKQQLSRWVSYRRRHLRTYSDICRPFVKDVFTSRMSRHTNAMEMCFHFPRLLKPSPVE